MSITTYATTARARRVKAWDALIGAYESAAPGAPGYWFTTDTMKFWSTILVGKPVTTPGDTSGRTYFVSSERTFDFNGRGYTVRAFDPERGNIDTIGELNGYENAADAVAAMHAVAGVEA